MLFFICLFLFSTGSSAELDCTVMPGRLKQIDAGSGEVYGVSEDGNIYQWQKDNWVQIPGQLTHVTVGPAGLWGVNKQNYIFKMQNNNWQQVSGLLKQVDAGGEKFLSGANAQDMIYCLNEDFTTSTSVSFPFTNIDGRLKYYSCGPLGCWGVNSANNIFYRYSVTPTACQGSRWQQVDGSLVMIEVSTDGSVYGVNSQGDVYKREGICPKNPIGTSWTRLDLCSNIQHVTYDAGYLWILTEKGHIFKCPMPESLLKSYL
ncbi:fish-egg lectin-like [Rhinophrynus dorsalis]